MNFVLAGRKIEMQMSIDSDSATDQELLYALRVSGCPEPEVSDLMARALRPGDIAIDGGANIGFFTVLMSKLVPGGGIVAIEPGQNNFPKLKKNINLNGFTPMDLVRQPLWDKVESLQLHMCVDGSKNSLAPHAETRGIEMLDSVMLDNWSDLDVRLIKLDIEGAEEKALLGGTTLLGKCPYIVAELNAEALPKFGSSPEHVIGFMREWGYEPFLLHPNGALPTYLPQRTKVAPNRLNWNVLFSTFEMVGAAWPEIVA